MTGNNLVGALAAATLFSMSPVFAQSPPHIRPQTPPLPPSVSVDYGSLSGPLNAPLLRAVKITYGGELTVNADEAQGDLPRQDYTVTGHVRIHETDTTLKAAKVQFHGGGGFGTATDVMLTRYPITIRGAEVQLTPETITALHGNFTTAPPNASPDYEIRASKITFTPSRYKVLLTHASLYLFHTRLLTVPRVRISVGGGGSGGARRRGATIPILSASQRYGVYAMLQGTLGGKEPFAYQFLLPTREVLQVQITGTQPLILPPALSIVAPAAPVPHNLLGAIHTLATLPAGPLPAGDPLLFHDFLPEANPIRLFDARSRGGLFLNENISNHVAAYGNRRDDLYVSRLPEISVSGSAPVTRLPPPRLPDDPQGFRDELRHIVLYVSGQATLGYYREQPTNIWRRRERYQIGLDTLPLLVAPNTIIEPHLLLTTNGYSGGKHAYAFNQLSVAVTHDFTPYSALGFQFFASNVSGASPFNFDVLDTSREVDARLQIGNRRLAVAGQLRYDLQHSDVIGYQAAIAPGFSGFTPVISYNFRTRSIGLGIEIPGLTF